MAESGEHTDSIPVRLAYGCVGPQHHSRCMLFLFFNSCIPETAHVRLTRQRFKELSFSRLECEGPWERVCLRDSGKSSTVAGPCDLETWTTNKVQENKLDVADATMCGVTKRGRMGEMFKLVPEMKYVFKYSAVSNPLSRSNRFTLHP